MSVTRAVSWSDATLVSDETRLTNQFLVTPFAMTPNQTFTNSLTLTNLSPTWTIGATIRYTNQFAAFGPPANATAASASWPGTQSITNPQCYSFIAIKPDYTPSAVQNYAYQTTVATPTFTQTYNATYTAVTNRANSTTPNSIIYYTIDGSTPTTSSMIVPPVVTSPGITVKAMAWANGYLNSGVASITTVAATPVVFSPNGHDPVSYATSAIPVTVTAAPGSTIHYRVGGNPAWQTTNSGSAFTINGIDNGWGTIHSTTSSWPLFQETNLYGPVPTGLRAT